MLMLILMPRLSVAAMLLMLIDDDAADAMMRYADAFCRLMPCRC